MTSKSTRIGGLALPSLRRRSADAARLSEVLEMTDAAFEQAIEAIRANHPEYTDEQVRLAATRLRVGDEVFSRAHPGAERLEP